MSLVGGLVGGELLMSTSDTRFLTLLPWLMLAATAMFTFGGGITARVRRWRAARTRPGGSAAPGHAAPGHVAPEHLAPRSPHRAPIWILALQLVIATYGGYFGGGMGIMMLAAFAVAGMTDIHEMNGLKVMLALATNGMALGAFIIDGAIVWEPGVVMVAGGMVGGYFGAFMARKVGPSAVWSFVVAAGWLMTAYFFVR